MVGLWSEQASGFLLVVALVAVLTLGLPMLVAPLTWASWLRWPIPEAPEGRHLSIYFGRCLGAVICVQAAVVLGQASERSVQPVLFGLLIGNFALMVAVHVWGALRETQPLSETIETGAWAVLLVLAIAFYPT
jgi:CBS-domain-containing membrane protein